MIQLLMYIIMVLAYMNHSVQCTCMGMILSIQPRSPDSFVNDLRILVFCIATFSAKEIKGSFATRYNRLIILRLLYICFFFRRWKELSCSRTPIASTAISEWNSWSQGFVVERMKIESMLCMCLIRRTSSGDWRWS